MIKYSVDLCNPNPCINNGMCVPDGTCQCGDEYRGDQCEIEIPLCEQIPNYCVNGDCNNGGYCDCFPGYSGETCEMDIDDCLNNQGRVGY